MMFNQFSLENNGEAIVIKQDNTSEFREYPDEVFITLEQLDSFINALQKIRGE